MHHNAGHVTHRVSHVTTWQYSLSSRDAALGQLCFFHKMLQDSLCPLRNGLEGLGSSESPADAAWQHSSGAGGEHAMLSWSLCGGCFPRSPGTT